MGGAVSIEPERTPDIIKVLAVITKEDRMEDLFKQIALNGHEEEGIRHTFLGSKKDTLCLPEILLFIAKGKHPLFSYMCVKPLSIIKEAFYYAVDVNTMEIDEKDRIAMKKEMNLNTFYLFLANLFMFSRLWQIFEAADDGIEDEFISREEFCRAKGKLESMGGVKMHRNMTDAQWSKGFTYIDDSKDEQIEFHEFIHFCTKFIVTPEEYLIKAISVSVVKRASIYDISPDSVKPLLHRGRTKSQLSKKTLLLKQNSVNEENEEEGEENNTNFDQISYDQADDDMLFEELIKKVKDSRHNIVRTYSDLSSVHGYGDLPTKEDLTMLEEKARVDKTAQKIGEWANRRIAENNFRSQRHLQLGESDQNNGKDRLHDDRVDGSEVNDHILQLYTRSMKDDQLNEEEGEVLGGYLNMDSLEAYSQIGFDFNENVSQESIISATTLLSIAENISKQPESSTRTMDEYDDSIHMQDEHMQYNHHEDEDFSVASTSPEILYQKENNFNFYRVMQNPPEHAFGHFYQPKSIETVSQSSKLNVFMKERQNRQASFYDTKVINSLVCNRKKSILKCEHDSVNAVLPRGTVHHENQSLNDSVCSVCSEDDDMMSHNSNNSCSNQFSISNVTANSTANVTTCTPNEIDVDNKFDDESDSMSTYTYQQKKPTSTKINVISLIENLILAQFETDETQQRKDHYLSNGDDYSISATSEI